MTATYLDIGPASQHRHREKPQLKPKDQTLQFICSHSNLRAGSTVKKAASYGAQVALLP